MSFILETHHGLGETELGSCGIVFQRWLLQIYFSRICILSSWFGGFDWAMVSRENPGWDKSPDRNCLVD